MYPMSTVKGWETLVFLVLTILLWLPQRAEALSSNFSCEIQSHHLSVQIDPPSHFIRAEDQLELRVKRRSSPPILSFLLNSSLRIVRIADKKQGNLLRWEESLSSGDTKRVDVSLNSLEEAVSVVISYEGKIYDPVVREKSLHFSKGDETSGLIGGEGVYLTGGSQWYPDMPDSMALFHAEVSIPAPYRAVTQGQLLWEVHREGLWKSRWSNNIPAEGLTLVAGKYVVRTREAEGIALRTYFFEEDERFSDMFLDATAEYLKIYSDLLGPYPFKKFDVVQNFFASGYGFPSFTLLAPEAIRQGTAPAPAPWPKGLDDDQVNAIIFERERERSLPEVLEDWRQTHRQLMEAVQAMSDDELFFQKAAWLGDAPFAESIAGNSYEHQQEHAGQIRVWLDAS